MLITVGSGFIYHFFKAEIHVSPLLHLAPINIIFNIFYISRLNMMVSPETSLHTLDRLYQVALRAVPKRNPRPHSRQAFRLHDRSRRSQKSACKLWAQPLLSLHLCLHQYLLFGAGRTSPQMFLGKQDQFPQATSCTKSMYRSQTSPTPQRHLERYEMPIQMQRDKDYGLPGSTDKPYHHIYQECVRWRDLLTLENDN